MAETQKHGEQHEQDYRLHDCRGDTGRRDALERCRAGRRKRVRILPRRLFVRNATVRLRHGGAVRRHDFRSRRQLRSKSAAVRGERLLRSRAEAPRPYASSTSKLTANRVRSVFAPELLRANLESRRHVFIQADFQIAELKMSSRAKQDRHSC
jgi:hypothetical protein